MAGSSLKSKKKREHHQQQSILEDNPNPQKKLRNSSDPQETEQADYTTEAAHPWRNLQLILSLQTKEIDLQKKVELAYNYVNLNSRAKGEDNDIEEKEEDCETVNLARLVVFLNDWVQSLLISRDKKITSESGVVIEACLDYRCWVVFKFCLEQSLRFRVSLSLSRNLLRAFSCVSRNALLLVTETNLDCKGLIFEGDRFELYTIVVDCVSLVFLSHGGLTNQNLELWISTARDVIELVLKIYDRNLEDGNVGFFALRFCCLVLEPFGKFLKVHPARKNGFRDFVDELLGPLLHLLGALRLRFDGSNPSWVGKLLPIAGEVLAQGLFHSVHIDGFLSLHSTENYYVSDDGRVKSSKSVNKSYHRHFFDKLETIMASKKETELSGLGELFQLLVDGAKKQKLASLLSEETKMAEKHDGSMHLSAHGPNLSSKASPEDSYVSSKLTSEKRKSLFDFFVQILEPLFIEMKSYLQRKLEIGSLLLDVHCTLKSINYLLASFSRENLYIKTEDITEGAFLNFLKEVYGTIFSFSTNLLSLMINDADCMTQETLVLLAKELIVALRYLVDIEYEVIENDLTHLWLMVFSYLAFGHFLKDAPNQCLLISQILEFGCQLIKLHSELRQVESSIFALCKAMRLVVVHENDGSSEQNYGFISFFGSCITSLPYDVYVKAAEIMLCAQEFKLAIKTGINSMPEGHANECIRQLSKDLSESIEWIRNSSLEADAKEHHESTTRSCRMYCFDLCMELSGRGLSEIYALVLDSLSVTIGNSSVLAKSIQDLMAIICPPMSILVKLQPDSVNEFLSFITGKTYCVRPDGTKHDMLNLGASTHWVFVFFFRLYLSCRSLFRQAIILMPPNISKKMSTVMCDSFTAYSGSNAMETTSWTDNGYFSWILHPSASLLLVIKSVSDNCLQGRNADFSPLIYVLHIMALQRLVDLNRQIKALEYMQKSIEGIIQVKLLDNDGLSQHCKRSRKWERHLSCLKEEAEGLVEYILSRFSLLDDDSISVQNTDAATCPANYGQALDVSDEWDLGVCSVNKKSLPTAIWWVVCRNIDIWSLHAGKKKFKMFLSHIIHTGISIMARGFTAEENNQAGETGFLNKISVHRISAELLTNSILYEHKFVRRHLASRFCRLLEKSVLSLFSDFSIIDVNLHSLPNWQEVLSAAGSLPVAVSGSKLAVCDELLEGKSVPHLSCETASDNSIELSIKKFGACQRLLSFFCWLPKGYMNSRSFSVYVTYLLNLERYTVSCLSECPDAMSSYNRYELIKLFISCRRALKYVVMAFTEQKTVTTHSSVIPVLSEDLFSILWLFKSVFMVFGLQETFSKDHSYETREMLITLMDHTSYVLLALSKHDCTCAIHSIIAKKSQLEQTNSKIAQEPSIQNGSTSLLDILENDKAWKSILFVAESLKEQTQDLLTSLKDALCNEKVQNHVDLVDLNKLSCTVSWISGFLWGLASSLHYTNATDGDRKLLRFIFGRSSQIGRCINVFADCIQFILHMLFVDDGHQPGSSFDVQNVQSFDQCDQLHSVQISSKQSPEAGGPGGSIIRKSIAPKKCSTLSTTDGSLKSAEVAVTDVLSNFDTYKCDTLNISFLQSLLNGDNHEAAILIRQLLLASSALLKLNLLTSCTSSLSSLVPSFIGISHVMLLKLSDVSERPQPFSFVWLDGVLKYLQELASHFPSKKMSTTAENVYARLIELHLSALGKCITLQGKEAKLASLGTESYSKMPSSNEGSSDSSFSHMSLFLDELKARLRMSFKVLISKSTELHMLPAIQTIGRALIGVQDGYKIIYEINTGSADGGKVASTVAAGVDCLDLVLECISGGRQSTVVREHVQKTVAALFNIIIHLQSPLIFYSQSKGVIHNDPDPGAVILMCVEVLTRVSGKRGLQISSCHVGQFLHVPAALFQDFWQLRLSKGLPLSDLCNQDCNSEEGMHSSVVDINFSVELFAACCQLLYTTVKHQKRESEKCIAVLQESASVLLHCLETIDNHSRVRKGYFSWGVQEGVKSACALRRIYEELRQQKDDFGQHCFKFLSDYIWVYSGYGPLKTGIRREIDEALKPGVYALIDTCSADNLQYLHSVFGESPCRDTLAVLQHDYKLNFQYEGKV
ncbi:uncharacterized protein LOC126680105 [Mercurialis annua]|uniref:uncharacterized protein LOC126680105 n=1 Tax=Mercurialis annua TaxID=3986 RepID=UPI00216028C6|nr:uncharacterized protein LOC126680105 [Mercurialis annua]